MVLGTERSSAYPCPRMPLYALTIFLGAFLLFQVQPLIAKFILPWFGGSAAVWTTCMLFFQVFLLAGYAYAHISIRYLTPRRQALLHTVLLLAALVLLPIIPGGEWKPTPADVPVERILLLLTVCLGLPYLVLAATGPLLQAWFSHQHVGVSPYRLYALSNVGSLLALLSYPFVFEPAWTRQTQADVWAWSLGLFAVLCSGCAWRQWKSSSVDKSEQEIKNEPTGSETAPTAYARMMWFLLPACGSVLLLASTNKLCLDLAAMPFLWVLPLSFYLLSFVLCFDRPQWYARKTFTGLLIPVGVGVCYLLWQGSGVSLLPQIVVYCGGVFIGCMVCHGEVYRLKPAPRFLTSFYLWVATGGALGGIFVAVVAPLVLRSYTEVHWGSGLLGVALLVIHWHDKSGLMIRGKFRPVWPVTAAVGLIVALSLFFVFRFTNHDVIFSNRNFYGVIRVVDVESDDPLFHAHKFISGRISHGMQFLDPAKARIPTTYFHELTGVGLAFKYLPVQTNRHIGVLGLGIGTLAAYARKGDTWRFYEINPQVQQLAETRFSYLSQAPGHLEIVLGDGRLSLEREPDQHFDLLVLDAFSSDAVPVHLLTHEAFAVYLRHLKPEGVIAVNITNRYVNLLPVLLDLATSYDLGLVDIRSKDGDTLWWYNSSRWVLMSHNRDFLTTKQIQIAAGASSPERKTLRWTDDHTSLFPIMRW